MRKLTLFAGALGLTLAVAASPASAASDRSFTKTFPVPADATLRLANLAGRIELSQAPGSELKVEAHVFAEGKDAAETRRLLDQMSWVEGRDKKGNPEWALSYPVNDYRGFAYPGSGRGERHDEPGVLERLLESFNLGNQSTGTYLGKRVSVYGSPGASVPVLYADLKIALPATGKVRVRNLIGPVDGGDLAGDLVVDTGSGAVKIDGFTGNLYVDTGSGSVKLGRARGETKVDTGSGGIRVAELVGNGDLDTGSGSVQVEKVAAGKLRIDTGSG
ncbi:MAG TPA: hypothetical protein PK413_11880, partial [Thermoanaerobaculia bacterium]|nr:hypothetical protein [Thermoanaerobaculia bacterium]